MRMYTCLHGKQPLAALWTAPWLSQGHSLAYNCQSQQAPRREDGNARRAHSPGDKGEEKGDGGCLQVLHPVRARVELRRVCLVLDSRAKRWVVPLAGARAEDLEDDEELHA